MRFAYADPPYLGQCRQYDHRHEAPWRCWDDPETHRQLIDWLVDEFPDGWALSGISTTLRTILPMCPPDVRVGAWCKTFAAFKKGVRPAYHWEPIIFWRGRNPNAGHPDELWLIALRLDPDHAFDNPYQPDGESKWRCPNVDE